MKIIKNNEIIYSGRPLTAHELKIYGSPQSYTLQYEQSEVLQLRRNAYEAQSDPLFMEWQYDQTDAKKQAWQNAVATIKSRYPIEGE
ncbi:hypothetical protein [Algicola sagamiensis]|uniref:hypothetical protein n=1 Tax=Algicola sagamiensis TaxID=163869 RepID=UPI0003802CD2|nr:hypothetical protein [Algicola sagamiensis]